MNERVAQQFLKFFVIGGIGFLVDASLLLFLIASGLSPFTSRIFSFSCAFTVTWIFNSAWTFASPQKTRVGGQYLRYMLVQCCGALANYAIYAVTLIILGVSPLLTIFALGIGAIAGLAVNFTGSKYFVFKAKV